MKCYACLEERCSILSGEPEKSSQKTLATCELGVDHAWMEKHVQWIVEERDEKNRKRKLRCIETKAQEYSNDGELILSLFVCVCE